MNKTQLSYFILIFIALIWSTTFLLTKEAMSGVNPIMLLVYRFGIATTVLGGFLLIKGKNIFQDLHFGVISGILLWLFFVCHNLGISFTTANNATFLLGLFIVFVPFLSRIIFKRKITTSEYISLGITVTGVWFITGGLSQINLGDIICIFGSFFYGLFLVICNLINKREDPLVEAFQQFLTISILSFLIVLFFKLPMAITTDFAFYTMLYLAFFPALLCFSLLNIAEKHVDSLMVSFLTSLDTLFAPILAVLIGFEALTDNLIIGGSLIILSMVVVNPRLKQKIRQLINRARFVKTTDNFNLESN